MKEISNFESGDSESSVSGSIDDGESEEPSPPLKKISHHNSSHKA